MRIMIRADRETDSAAYLGEMLSLWGSAWHEVAARGRKAVGPAEFPALLVPAGAAAPPAEILAYAGAGGHALLVTPARELLAGLGMPLPLEYGDDGEISFLRQAGDLLGSFSRYPLEVTGRRALPVGVHYAGAGERLRAPADALVWAWMYEAGVDFADRPAVWTVPRGKGWLTVFAYDPLECFRDLRQGRPRYAGWRPAHDDICRPAHLFGPHWPVQAQPKHLPAADFHPMLLTRLVERFWPLPAPRFRQLPGLEHSAFLLSGDEDGAPPADTRKICAFLETLGARTTIYIQMLGTQSTPEDLRRLEERGHSFSVHPYPAPGRAVAGPGLLAELERCVGEFRARYGSPARTVRNHRLIWTGYADVPRLWERLGVEADCNYGPLFSDRGFSSIYGACSGVLPVRFLDENRRLVNVLQFPLGLSDDAWFDPGPNPKTMSCGPELAAAVAGSLFRDTLQPLGGVFDVIFHPPNYARFAAAAEEAMLRRARSLGVALRSETEWLDFWKMRAAWRVAGMKKSATGAVYSLRGEKPSRALALSLPAGAARVTVDGAPLATVSREHFGAERRLAVLPDGLDRAEVAVEYPPAGTATEKTE